MIPVVSSAGGNGGCTTHTTYLRASILCACLLVRRAGRRGDLLGRQLGPSNRGRVTASRVCQGPERRNADRAQSPEIQNAECRVQDAGCRPSHRSIVSDGRFDRLRVPEWAASQGDREVLIKVRGRDCGCGCICSRGRCCCWPAGL